MTMIEPIIQIKSMKKMYELGGETVIGSKKCFPRYSKG